MPEASHIPIPFPFGGLNEYVQLTDQTPDTSADLQNVVAVDPISGRRRGAQRPGIAKFVGPLINGMSSIQDINHITGPNFTKVSGQDQMVAADPDGASWTLISSTGGANPGPGADVYQTSCWDASGNVYIVSRAAASTDVRIDKFNVGQALLWSVTITHGSTSTTIPPVAGIVVIGTVLFVLFDGAGAYNDAIYRYYTSTGASVDGAAWASAGVEFVGTPFQTHDGHYLASSGGYLGIVTTAGTPGSSDLKLWLDVLNPSSKAVVSSTAVQTLTNDGNASDTMNCYALEGDGTGNFFISGIKYDASATTYTTFIEYRDSAGVVVSGWATPITSSGGATEYASGIAYDSENDRLAAVGPNVMGTGFSFVIYDGADKSQDAGFDPTSASVACTELRRVYADSTGGFRVTRENSAYNMASIGSDLGVEFDWIENINEDDQDRPLSINTTLVVQPDGLRPRETRLIVTAGGTPKLVDRLLNSVADITSGANSLSATAPRIFSSAYYPDLYFADGMSAKFYKPSTGFIVNWTNKLTAGSLPVDADGNRHTLIANWNARLVLSGVAGDPQNWFMSAQANPLDFDYSPATTVSTQAVSGNTSDAGTMQDVINSLMPWERDYLLIGMDHSISALSGNPAAGGRFDILTDVTGVAWGRPFSMHPDGSIWFIGSRGGLYRLGAGERKPYRVSETTIDERLADLALDTVVVEMQWDDRMQAFLIIISPIDQTTATTHYLYDVRNNAWFPWVFATVAQNPKVIHLMDGDAVADRVLLMGSWDGYLRNVDYDSDDDDGVAIDSYVMIGPLQNGAMVPILLSGLQAVLGASASDVTYSVHVGDSAEEALAAAESFGGKFAAGRGRWSRQRVSGHAIYIKLRNSANNETWSLERLNAMVSQTSEAFARRF